MSLNGKADGGNRVNGASGQIRNQLRRSIRKRNGNLRKLILPQYGHQLLHVFPLHTVLVRLYRDPRDAPVYSQIPGNLVHGVRRADTAQGNPAVRGYGQKVLKGFCGICLKVHLLNLVNDNHAYGKFLYDLRHHIARPSDIACLLRKHFAVI